MGLQKLKRFEKTLAFLHSIPGGIVRHANFFTPMLHAQRFTAHSVETRIPSIQDLAYPRGPLAILFTIVSVIFDSVKRHTRGAVSHISVKVFKTFHPALANRYTSSSIVFKPRPIRIIATIFHTLPCPINRSPAHSVLGLQSNSKASARRNKAVSQVSTSTRCLRAATAYTFPHCMFRFSGASFDNSKIAKTFSCNVNKITHCFSLLELINYNTVGY